MKKEDYIKQKTEIIQKRIEGIENSLIRDLKDEIKKMADMSDEEFEKIKKINSILW